MLRPRLILALAAATLFGIAVGLVASNFVTWQTKNAIAGDFVVREIDAVEEADGNLLVRLHVFLAGDNGHVRLVKCLFPSDTKLTVALEQPKSIVPQPPVAENPSNPFAEFKFEDVTTWSGITRVRVGGTADHIDAETYYCRALPASA
jgi:hypothetical protein